MSGCRSKHVEELNFM